MAVDFTSLQVLIMITLFFFDRFVRWPPKGYHTRAVCPTVFYHCSYMAVDCTSLQVLIMITLHVINAVSNLGCFFDRFVRWPPKGYHAHAVCPIFASVCLVYRFGMTH